MAYDLVAHKVHCPRCRRLVSAVQHKYGNRLSLACPRCGRPLWLHESGCWYYVKHAPDSEAEEKAG